jgi:acyl carrier protein
MEAAINSSVLDRVVLALEQTACVGDFGITLTTRLADDLELGRFGLVKLALLLEEIFNVELSDEVLKRFFTVGDVVQHLSRRYFHDAEFPAFATAA